MMVSVLMPVYNGEKHLRDAINSILNQTYTNFEFIIINDGSTDSSKEIILSYNDPRIVYVENEKNMGLSATLNKGIDLCTAEYIARMDCDDIAKESRFAKQVAFLDANTDVGIVGSFVKVIGSSIIYRFPLKTEEIKVELLLRSVLQHPSVMIRKSLLNQFDLRYDINYRYSQDYDLWARAVQYFPIYNLEEILLEYREHEQQMGATYGSCVRDEPVRTRLMQIELFTGLAQDNPKILLHGKVLNGGFEFTKDKFQELCQWLAELEQMNLVKKEYQEKGFKYYLFFIWQTAFFTIKEYNLATYRFIKETLFYKELTARQKISFLFKCLVGKKKAR